MIRTVVPYGPIRPINFVLADLRIFKTICIFKKALRTYELGL